MLREFQGEKRERRGKTDFFKEIITEKLSNLGREIDIQVNEVQKSLNMISPKKTTLRYIIIKLSEIKDRERI